MQTEPSFLATTAGEEAHALFYRGASGTIWQSVINETEKGMITKMLVLTDGNQSKTVMALGINRATLTAKIKLHNLKHLCKSTGEHNARHFAAKREGGAA